MADEKVKFLMRIDPDTDRKIKIAIPLANCRSQNDLQDGVQVVGKVGIGVFQRFPDIGSLVVCQTEDVYKRQSPLSLSPRLSIFSGKALFLFPEKNRHVSIQLLSCLLYTSRCV